jgi:hypothetical protein
VGWWHTGYTSQPGLLDFVFFYFALHRRPPPFVGGKTAAIKVKLGAAAPSRKQV